MNDWDMPPQTIYYRFAESVVDDERTVYLARLRATGANVRWIKDVLPEARQDLGLALPTGDRNMISVVYKDSTVEQTAQEIHEINNGEHGEILTMVTSERLCGGDIGQFSSDRSLRL